METALTFVETARSLEQAMHTLAVREFIRAAMQ
jgi:hypothetical protein